MEENTLNQQPQQQPQQQQESAPTQGAGSQYNLDFYKDSIDTASAFAEQQQIAQLVSQGYSADEAKQLAKESGVASATTAGTLDTFIGDSKEFKDASKQAYFTQLDEFSKANLTPEEIADPKKKEKPKSKLETDTSSSVNSELTKLYAETADPEALAEMGRRTFLEEHANKINTSAAKASFSFEEANTLKKFETNPEEITEEDIDLIARRTPSELQAIVNGDVANQLSDRAKKYLKYKLYASTVIKDGLTDTLKNTLKSASGSLVESLGGYLDLPITLFDTYSDTTSKYLVDNVKFNTQNDPTANPITAWGQSIRNSMTDSAKADISIGQETNQLHYAVADDLRAIAKNHYIQAGFGKNTAEMLANVQVEAQQLYNVYLQSATRSSDVVATTWGQLAGDLLVQAIPYAGTALVTAKHTMQMTASNIQSGQDAIRQIPESELAQDYEVANYAQVKGISLHDAKLEIERNKIVATSVATGLAQGLLYRYVGNKLERGAASILTGLNKRLVTSKLARMTPDAFSKSMRNLGKALGAKPFKAFGNAVGEGFEEIAQAQMEYANTQYILGKDYAEALFDLQNDSKDQGYQAFLGLFLPNAVPTAGAFKALKRMSQTSYDKISKKSKADFNKLAKQMDTELAGSGISSPTVKKELNTRLENLNKLKTQPDANQNKINEETVALVGDVFGGTGVEVANSLKTNEKIGEFVDFVQNLPDNITDEELQKSVSKQFGSGLAKTLTTTYNDFSSVLDAHNPTGKATFKDFLSGATQSASEIHKFAESYKTQAVIEDLGVSNLTESFANFANLVKTSGEGTKASRKGDSAQLVKQAYTNIEKEFGKTPEGKARLEALLNENPLLKSELNKILGRQSQQNAQPNPSIKTTAQNAQATAQQQQAQPNTPPVTGATAQQGQAATQATTQATQGQTQTTSTATLTNDAVNSVNVHKAVSFALNNAKKKLESQRAAIATKDGDYEAAKQSIQDAYLLSNLATMVAYNSVGNKTSVPSSSTLSVEEKAGLDVQFAEIEESFNQLVDAKRRRNLNEHADSAVLPNFTYAKELTNNTAILESVQDSLHAKDVEELTDNLLDKLHNAYDENYEDAVGDKGSYAESIRHKNLIDRITSKKPLGIKLTDLRNTLDKNSYTKVAKSNKSVTKAINRSNKAIGQFSTDKELNKHLTKEQKEKKDLLIGRIQELQDIFVSVVDEGSSLTNDKQMAEYLVKRNNVTAQLDAAYREFNSFMYETKNALAEKGVISKDARSPLGVRLVTTIATTFEAQHAITASYAFQANAVLQNKRTFQLALINQLDRAKDKGDEAAAAKYEQLIALYHQEQETSPLQRVFSKLAANKSTLLTFTESGYESVGDENVLKDADLKNLVESAGLSEEENKTWRTRYLPRIKGKSRNFFKNKTKEQIIEDLKNVEALAAGNNSAGGDVTDALNNLIEKVADQVIAKVDAQDTKTRSYTPNRKTLRKINEDFRSYNKLKQEALEAIAEERAENKPEANKKPTDTKDQPEVTPVLEEDLDEDELLALNTYEQQNYSRFSFRGFLMGSTLAAASVGIEFMISPAAAVASLVGGTLGLADIRFIGDIVRKIKGTKVGSLLGRMWAWAKRTKPAKPTKEDEAAKEAQESASNGETNISDKAADSSEINPNDPEHKPARRKPVRKRRTKADADLAARFDQEYASAVFEGEFEEVAATTDEEESSENIAEAELEDLTSSNINYKEDYNLPISPDKNSVFDAAVDAVVAIKDSYDENNDVTLEQAIFDNTLPPINFLGVLEGVEGLSEEEIKDKAKDYLKEALLKAEEPPLEEIPEALGSLINEYVDNALTLKDEYPAEGVYASSNLLVSDAYQSKLSAIKYHNRGFLAADPKRYTFDASDQELRVYEAETMFSESNGISFKSEEDQYSDIMNSAQWFMNEMPSLFFNDFKSNNADDINLKAVKEKLATFIQRGTRLKRALLAANFIDASGNLRDAQFRAVFGASITPNDKNPLIANPELSAHLFHRIIAGLDDAKDTLTYIQQYDQQNATIDRKLAVTRAQEWYFTFASDSVNSFTNLIQRLKDQNDETGIVTSAATLAKNYHSTETLLDMVDELFDIRSKLEAQYYSFTPTGKNQSLNNKARKDFRDFIRTFIETVERYKQDELIKLDDNAKEVLVKLDEITKEFDDPNTSDTRKDALINSNRTLLSKARLTLKLPHSYVFKPVHVGKGETSTAGQISLHPMEKNTDVYLNRIRETYEKKREIDLSMLRAAGLNIDNIQEAVKENLQLRKTNPTKDDHRKANSNRLLGNTQAMFLLSTSFDGTFNGAPGRQVLTKHLDDIDAARDLKPSESTYAYERQKNFLTLKEGLIHNYGEDLSKFSEKYRSNDKDRSSATKKNSHFDTFKARKESFKEAERLEIGDNKFSNVYYKEVTDRFSTTPEDYDSEAVKRQVSLVSANQAKYKSESDRTKHLLDNYSNIQKKYAASSDTSKLDTTYNTVGKQNVDRFAPSSTTRASLEITDDTAVIMFGLGANGYLPAGGEKVGNNTRYRQAERELEDSPYTVKLWMERGDFNLSPTDFQNRYLTSFKEMENLLKGEVASSVKVLSGFVDQSLPHLITEYELLKQKQNNKDLLTETEENFIENFEKLRQTAPTVIDTLATDALNNLTQSNHVDTLSVDPKAVERQTFLEVANAKVDFAALAQEDLEFQGAQEKFLAIFGVPFFANQKWLEQNKGVTYNEVTWNKPYLFTDKAPMLVEAGNTYADIEDEATYYRKALSNPDKGVRLAAMKQLNALYRDVESVITSRKQETAYMVNLINNVAEEQVPDFLMKLDGNTFIRSKIVDTRTGRTHELESKEGLRLFLKQFNGGGGLNDSVETQRALVYKILLQKAVNNSLGDFQGNVFVGADVALLDQLLQYHSARGHKRSVAEVYQQTVKLLTLSDAKRKNATLYNQRPSVTLNSPRQALAALNPNAKSIPHIKNPVDSISFGLALIRGVNLNKRENLVTTWANRYESALTHKSANTDRNTHWDLEEAKTVYNGLLSLKQKLRDKLKNYDGKTIILSEKELDHLTTEIYKAHSDGQVFSDNIDLGFVQKVISKDPNAKATVTAPLSSYIDTSKLPLPQKGAFSSDATRILAYSGVYSGRVGESLTGLTGTLQDIATHNKLETYHFAELALETATFNSIKDAKATTVREANANLYGSKINTTNYKQERLNSVTGYIPVPKSKYHINQVQNSPLLVNILAGKQHFPTKDLDIAKLNKDKLADLNGKGVVDPNLEIATLDTHEVAQAKTDLAIHFIAEVENQLSNAFYTPKFLNETLLSNLQPDSADILNNAKLASMFHTDLVEEDKNDSSSYSSRVHGRITPKNPGATTKAVLKTLFELRERATANDKRQAEAEEAKLGNSQHTKATDISNTGNTVSTSAETGQKVSVEEFMMLLYKNMLKAHGMHQDEDAANEVDSVKLAQKVFAILAPQLNALDLIKISSLSNSATDASFNIVSIPAFSSSEEGILNIFKNLQGNELNDNYHETVQFVLEQMSLQPNKASFLSLAAMDNIRHEATFQHLLGVEIDHNVTFTPPETDPRDTSSKTIGNAVERDANHRYQHNVPFTFHRGAVNLFLATGVWDVNTSIEKVAADLATAMGTQEDLGNLLYEVAGSVANANIANNQDTQQRALALAAFLRKEYFQQLSVIANSPQGKAEGLDKLYNQVLANNKANKPNQADIDEFVRLTAPKLVMYIDTSTAVTDRNTQVGALNTMQGNALRSLLVPTRAKQDALYYLDETYDPYSYDFSPKSGVWNHLKHANKPNGEYSPVIPNLALTDDLSQFNSDEITVLALFKQVWQMGGDIGDIKIDKKSPSAIIKAIQDNVNGDVDEFFKSFMPDASIIALYEMLTEQENDPNAIAQAVAIEGQYLEALTRLNNKFSAEKDFNSKGTRVTRALVDYAKLNLMYEIRAGKPTIDEAYRQKRLAKYLGYVNFDQTAKNSFFYLNGRAATVTKLNLYSLAEADGVNDGTFNNMLQNTFDVQAFNTIAKSGVLMGAYGLLYSDADTATDLSKYIELRGGEADYYTAISKERQAIIEDNLAPLQNYLSSLKSKDLDKYRKLTQELGKDFAEAYKFLKNPQLLNKYANTLPIGKSKLLTLFKQFAEFNQKTASKDYVLSFGNSDATLKKNGGLIKDANGNIDKTAKLYANLLKNLDSIKIDIKRPDSKAGAVTSTYGGGLTSIGNAQLGFILEKNIGEHITKFLKSVSPNPQDRKKFLQSYPSKDATKVNDFITQLENKLNAVSLGNIPPTVRKQLQDLKAYAAKGYTYRELIDKVQELEKEFSSNKEVLNEWNRDITAPVALATTKGQEAFRKHQAILIASASAGARGFFAAFQKELEEYYEKERIAILRDSSLTDTEKAGRLSQIKISDNEMKQIIRRNLKHAPAFQMLAGTLEGQRADLNGLVKLGHILVKEFTDPESALEEGIALYQQLGISTSSLSVLKSGKQLTANKQYIGPTFGQVGVGLVIQPSLTSETSTIQAMYALLFNMQAPQLDSLYEFIPAIQAFYDGVEASGKSIYMMSRILNGVSRKVGLHNAGNAEILQQVGRLGVFTDNENILTGELSESDDGNLGIAVNATANETGIAVAKALQDNSTDKKVLEKIVNVDGKNWYEVFGSTPVTQEGLVRFLGVQQFTRAMAYSDIYPIILPELERMGKANNPSHADFVAAYRKANQRILTHYAQSQALNELYLTINPSVYQHFGGFGTSFDKGIFKDKPSADRFAAQMRKLLAYLIHSSDTSPQKNQELIAQLAPSPTKAKSMLESYGEAKLETTFRDLIRFPQQYAETIRQISPSLGLAGEDLIGVLEIYSSKFREINAKKLAKFAVTGPLTNDASPVDIGQADVLKNDIYYRNPFERFIAKYQVNPTEANKNLLPGETPVKTTKSHQYLEDYKNSSYTMPEFDALLEKDGTPVYSMNAYEFLNELDDDISSNTINAYAYTLEEFHNEALDTTQLADALKNFDLKGKLSGEATSERLENTQIFMSTGSKDYTALSGHIAAYLDSIGADIDKYEDIVESLLDSLYEGKANGYYLPITLSDGTTKGIVVLSPEVSNMQSPETLLHELSHAATAVSLQSLAGKDYLSPTELLAVTSINSSLKIHAAELSTPRTQKAVANAIKHGKVNLDDLVLGTSDKAKAFLANLEDYSRLSNVVLTRMYEEGINHIEQSTALIQTLNLQVKEAERVLADIRELKAKKDPKYLANKAKYDALLKRLELARNKALDEYIAFARTKPALINQTLKFNLKLSPEIQSDLRLKEDHDHLIKYFKNLELSVLKGLGNLAGSALTKNVKNENGDWVEVLDEDAISLHHVLSLGIHYLEFLDEYNRFALLQNGFVPGSLSTQKITPPLSNPQITFQLPAVKPNNSFLSYGTPNTKIPVSLIDEGYASSYFTKAVEQMNMYAAFEDRRAEIGKNAKPNQFVDNLRKNAQYNRIIRAGADKADSGVLLTKQGTYVSKEAESILRQQRLGELREVENGEAPDLIELEDNPKNRNAVLLNFRLDAVNKLKNIYRDLELGELSPNSTEEEALLHTFSLGTTAKAELLDQSELTELRKQFKEYGVTEAELQQLIQGFVGEDINKKINELATKKAIDKASTAQEITGYAYDLAVKATEYIYSVLNKDYKPDPNKPAASYSYKEGVNSEVIAKLDRNIRHYIISQRYAQSKTNTIALRSTPEVFQARQFVDNLSKLNIHFDDETTDNFIALTDLLTGLLDGPPHIRDNYFQGQQLESTPLGKLMVQIRKAFNNEARLADFTNTYLNTLSNIFPEISKTNLAKHTLTGYGFTKSSPDPQTAIGAQEAHVTRMEVFVIAAALASPDYFKLITGQRLKNPSDTRGIDPKLFNQVLTQLGYEGTKGLPKPRLEATDNFVVYASAKIGVDPTYAETRQTLANAVNQENHEDFVRMQENAEYVENNPSAAKFAKVFKDSPVTLPDSLYRLFADFTADDRSAESSLHQWLEEQRDEILRNTEGKATILSTALSLILGQTEKSRAVSSLKTSQHSILDRNRQQFMYTFIDTMESLFKESGYPDGIPEAHGVALQGALNANISSLFNPKGKEASLEDIQKAFGLPSQQEELSRSIYKELNESLAGIPATDRTKLVNLVSNLAANYAEYGMNRTNFTTVATSSIKGTIFDNSSLMQQHPVLSKLNKAQKSALVKAIERQSVLESVQRHFSNEQVNAMRDLLTKAPKAMEHFFGSAYTLHVKDSSLGFHGHVMNEASLNDTVVVVDINDPEYANITDNLLAKGFTKTHTVDGSEVYHADYPDPKRRVQGALVTTHNSVNGGQLSGNTVTNEIGYPSSSKFHKKDSHTYKALEKEFHADMEAMMNDGNYLANKIRTQGSTKTGSTIRVLSVNPNSDTIHTLTAPSRTVLRQLDSVPAAKNGIHSLARGFARRFEENQAHELNRRSLAVLKEAYEKDIKANPEHAKDYLKIDGKLPENTGNPTKDRFNKRINDFYRSLVSAHGSLVEYTNKSYTGKLSSEELNAYSQQYAGFNLQTIETTEVQQYSKGKNPESFKEPIYIRFADINDAIGYSNFTIDEVFDPNEGMTGRGAEATRLALTMMSSLPRAIIKRFIGRDMPTREFYTKTFEYIGDTVATARKFLIIKSVKVAMGNIFSNTMQLLASGVTPKFITEQVPQVYKELEDYTNTDRKIKELTFRLHSLYATQGKSKEVAQLELAIKGLQVKLKSNPISGLMEAGLYSSIIDDLTDYDIDAPVSITDKLLNSLDSAVARSLNPNSLSYKALNELLVTEKSHIHKWMTKATNLGDFVAKAVLYKHLTQRRNLSKEDAIYRVSDHFVNYSLNKGRGFDFMNKMGMHNFLTYSLGMFKIVPRMLRRNTMASLGTLGGIASTEGLFGVDIPDPLDSWGFTDITSKMFNAPHIVSAGLSTNPILDVLDEGILSIPKNAIEVMSGIRF